MNYKFHTIRFMLIFLLIAITSNITASVKIYPNDDRIAVDGALFLSKDSTRLIMDRYTQAILDSAMVGTYRLINPDVAKTPTGMILRFRTKSPNIQANFEIRSGYHTQSNFTIYCDDIWQKSITNVLSFSMQAPSIGIHTWKIYLPHYYALNFIGLRLDDGYNLEDNRKLKRPVYAAIGNSITNGMGQAYAVQTYPSILARKKNWDLINMAVGGAKITDAVSISLRNKEIDVITVLWGYNDFNAKVSPDTMAFDTTNSVKNRMGSLLNKLRIDHPKAAIYVLTQTYTTNTSNANTGLTIEDYRIATRNLVDSIQNAGDTLLFKLEGVDFTSASSLSDVVHLNTTGAARMADSLFKYVNIPGYVSGGVEVTVKDSSNLLPLENTIIEMCSNDSVYDIGVTNSLGTTILCSDTGLKYLLIKTPYYTADSICVNIQENDTLSVDVTLSKLPVTEFCIQPETLSLISNDSFLLHVYNKFSDGYTSIYTGEKVWSSTDTSVIKVDSTGMVRCFSTTGSTYVICSLLTLGLKDSIPVQVLAGTRLYLQASEDAYVRAGLYATQNFGFSGLISVKTASADYTRWAYYKYDISGVAIEDIVSASLNLYICSAQLDKSAGIYVYRVDNNTWSESEITWDTKPALDSLLGSLPINGGDTGFIKFNITDYIKGAQDNGIISFGLKDPISTDMYITFASKDTNLSAIHPVLEIITHESGTTDIEKEINNASIKIYASPNPFNPGTRIWVHGGQGAEVRDQKIKLKIYNINGKLIANLSSVRSLLTSGISWDASNKPSGLYFAHIKIGNKTFNKKLVLMR